MPLCSYASGFIWTVEYYLDIGDGKYQEVKIELPENIEGRYWKIPNVYSPNEKWKCGVTYWDMINDPLGISSRRFSCFPVDNLKYSVDVQISCEDSKPENSLLFFFGNNQLIVECKLK